MGKFEYLEFPATHLWRNDKGAKFETNTTYKSHNLDGETLGKRLISNYYALFHYVQRRPASDFFVEDCDTVFAELRNLLIINGIDWISGENKKGLVKLSFPISGERA